MIDLLNPTVSTVVKGMQGKTILIYGTNRTGKTRNTVKAPKPLVIAFEQGLNAVAGVPYVTINKWGDFTETVKQLTKADTLSKMKELYSTIIIDTIEGIADPAAKFICSSYGVDSVGEGKGGYGLWKEYSQLMEEPVKKLTQVGYTVVFLDHEGEREFLNEAGVKYTKIFPRGDKRIVNPVCDLCDFIGYAQLQPNDDANKEVKSTLYLKGTSAYHAGSRFKYVPQMIAEWDWEKIENAVVEAVNAEEKESGAKSITLESALKNKAKQDAEAVKATKPLSELIPAMAEMLTFMHNTESNTNTFEGYKKELGIPTDFKVTAATEAQYEVVESLYNKLIENGYDKKVAAAKKAASAAPAAPTETK